MFNLALLLNLTFEHGALAQGGSRRDGVAEPAQAAAEIGSGRKVRKRDVQSSRSRVDEVPRCLTIGREPAGIDPSDASTPENVNGALDIGGNLDRSREIVRRPERKNPHDGVTPNQGISDPADRSVATSRNHDGRVTTVGPDEAWQTLEVLDPQFADDLQAGGAYRYARLLDLVMPAGV